MNSASSDDLHLHVQSDIPQFNLLIYHCDVSATFLGCSDYGVCPSFNLSIEFITPWKYRDENLPVFGRFFFIIFFSQITIFTNLLIHRCKKKFKFRSVNR